MSESSHLPLDVVLEHRTSQVRSTLRTAGADVDEASAQRLAAMAILAERAGIGPDELAALLASPDRTALRFIESARSAPGRMAQHRSAARPGRFGRS